MYLGAIIFEAIAHWGLLKEQLWEWKCSFISTILFKSLQLVWRIKVRFCQKVLKFLLYLQTGERFTFLNLKIWILVISKAALASQMLSFSSYKSLSFQTLKHSQFLSNFQSPKLKFSVSGKKNVRLFGVSVSSNKNVPLIKAETYRHLGKVY